MVIAVRKDLGMSRGKLVAQGAHAAVGAYAMSPLGPLDLAGWVDEGQKKVVVSVDSEEALLALEEAAGRLELTSYLVRDYGLTEVEEGTATAIAIGPAYEDELAPITGALRLYR